MPGTLLTEPEIDLIAAWADNGAPQGNTAHAPEPLEFSDEWTLGEPDLVVTTDVSFPVEVQTGDALADQLKKLNTLMAQGVLTEEEYAVAKAKLLG